MGITIEPVPQGEKINTGKALKTVPNTKLDLGTCPQCIIGTFAQQTRVFLGSCVDWGWS